MIFIPKKSNSSLRAIPLWEPQILQIKAYRFCGPSPRILSAKRSNIVRSFESTGLGRANPE